MCILGLRSRCPASKLPLKHLCNHFNPTLSCPSWSAADRLPLRFPWANAACLQVDAKDQEVNLWKERCERQEEMLAGASERESALQAHLEGARASVGEAGTTMEQHLAKYAEYQEAINKSNEVGC